MSCEIFNVHSDPFAPNFLDYVVDDALDCCEKAFQPVSPENKLYCMTAHLSDPQNKTDCLRNFIDAGLNLGYSALLSKAQYGGPGVTLLLSFAAMVGQKAVLTEGAL